MIIVYVVFGLAWVAYEVMVIVYLMFGLAWASLQIYSW